MLLVVAEAVLRGVFTVPVAAVVRELEPVLLARVCERMARDCAVLVAPRADEVFVCLAEAFARVDAGE
jgi:hypothetical protein